MSGNLKSFIPQRPEGDVYTLEDMKDIPLTILGYSDAMGEHGPIAFMDCLNPQGEKVRIMAGATLVLEALHGAKAANAFPVEATFKKPGKAWICA